MASYNISILISGAGTNAINIIEYFSKKKLNYVTLLISNNKNSNAFNVAQKKGIKTVFFNNDAFKNNGVVLNFLKNESIDYIILSGFLLKIPKEIIQAYPNRIINLHPSLLPKFGGKGMYGRKVHEAVIYSKEKISGITIHFVNEEYDKGRIIFQHKVVVNDGESVDGLSKKIKAIEHRFFPLIIEQILCNSI